MTYYFCDFVDFPSGSSAGFTSVHLFGSLHLAAMLGWRLKMASLTSLVVGADSWLEHFDVFPCVFSSPSRLFLCGGLREAIQESES